MAGERTEESLKTTEKKLYNIVDNNIIINKFGMNHFSP